MPIQIRVAWVLLDVFKNVLASDTRSHRCFLRSAPAAPPLPRDPLQLGASERQEEHALRAAAQDALRPPSAASASGHGRHIFDCVSKLLLDFAFLKLLLLLL